MWEELITSLGGGAVFAEYKKTQSRGTVQGIKEDSHGANHTIKAISVQSKSLMGFFRHDVSTHKC